MIAAASRSMLFQRGARSRRTPVIFKSVSPQMSQMSGLAELAPKLLGDNPFHRELVRVEAPGFDLFGSEILCDPVRPRLEARDVKQPPGRRAVRHRRAVLVEREREDARLPICAVEGIDDVTKVRRILHEIPYREGLRRDHRIRKITGDVDDRLHFVGPNWSSPGRKRGTHSDYPV